MNQYIGKSRGGNTTKIHAVVDALGNPIYFKLSGGQINDNTVVIDLLSNIDIKSANILAIKLTELKILERTSLHKKLSIQFRQSQILKNHGIVTGGIQRAPSG